MNSPYFLYRGFFRLSIVFGIAAVFAAIITVFTSTRVALDVLAALGYPEYLQVSATNTWGFLIQCLNNELCYPNLLLATQNAYPTWVLYVAAGLWISALTFGILKARTRARAHDPATGQWSTPKHLAKKGYIADKRRKDQRGYVGMLPNGKMLRVPEKIRFSHALVLGGPGAKKSTGYHWQNILSDAMDGVSVIVFDLKFPDPKGGFVSALPYFEKQGYDVYAFAPYEENTHHLPLIQDAVNEVTAREIAEMLIPPSEDGGAAFFKRTERRALTGLLMHAAACNISLTQLHSILQQGAPEIRRFMNGKGRTEYQPAVSQVMDIVSSLLNADPKDQHGLLEGIAGALEFFANPQLGNATRRADEPWLNIPLDQIAVKKSILYVGLPQKNVDGGSGKMLLQLIKRMIDSALSQTAYDNGGEVPNPVSFYLDEFPSLGKLPNVESNFATMRSRRVAYHVTVQNISQGKAIYTDAGFKSFFTSNFQTIMLFPSFIKFDDADYISKILGNVMTTMYGQGASKGGAFDTRSSNEREATRPLVTIDEMQTWPADEAIVILNGVPHTRVIIPGIFEEKVAGIRNPFTPIWKTLDKNMNAPQYINDLVERERKQWAAQKVRESLEVAKAHGATITVPAVTTPAPPEPTPTTEPTAKRPTAQEAPAPAEPVDHRTLPVDPSSLKYVETPSGKKFIPRDAINKLVDHITRANTSIKVEGDKKQHKIEALHVPVDIVTSLFKPEQVEALVKEGYVTIDGHVSKIHFNRDGLLEASRATFLLKKIPAEKPSGSRISRRKAQRALNQAVKNAISNGLAARIEYNAKQNAVQSITFNKYALLPEANPELEQGWQYHKLVTLEDASARVRRKALTQLPEDITQLVIRRYYSDRNQPVPQELIELWATEAAAPNAKKQADPATTASRADASSAVPAQPSAPDAPAASAVEAQPAPVQPVHQPLRPQRKTPPPAAAPVQPVPQAVPAQAQAAPVESVPTPAAPVESAPAQAAPAAPAQPASAPAAATPPPSASKAPSRPAGPPASTPPAQQAPVTWTQHPTDDPPTQMMVIHDTLALKRLHSWISTRASSLLVPGAAPPSKMVEGAYSPSSLHFFPDTYALNGPGAPAAPAVPTDPKVALRTTKVVSGQAPQIHWIIHVVELLNSADAKAAALKEWLLANAARIPGHPLHDPTQEALQGVAYHPGVLTIPPKAAKGILRTTESIEPKRVHPPARLPMAEAVHILVPDPVAEAQPA